MNQELVDLLKQALADGTVRLELDSSGHAVGFEWCHMITAKLICGDAVLAEGSMTI